MTQDGQFHGDPRTLAFAKFLIDLDQSPHAQAAVLGDLREQEMRGEVVTGVTPTPWGCAARTRRPQRAGRP